VVERGISARNESKSPLAMERAIIHADIRVAGTRRCLSASTAFLFILRPIIMPIAILQIPDRRSIGAEGKFPVSASAAVADREPRRAGRGRRSVLKIK